MTIHFGTDGWRAVISDTFTFHNLRLVAQAIADAVHSYRRRSISPKSTRQTHKEKIIPKQ
jgi:phosphomannomutase